MKTALSLLSVACIHSCILPVILVSGDMATILERIHGASESSLSKPSLCAKLWVLAFPQKGGMNDT